MEEKDLRLTPKRKLSEAEKQIINLKIERMKLEREKAILILGGGVTLFIAFITISIIGLLNDVISRNQLNLLVLVGIFALIVGIFPYMRFVINEQKSLEKTLEELIS